MGIPGREICLILEWAKCLLGLSSRGLIASFEILLVILKVLQKSKEFKQLPRFFDFKNTLKISTVTFQPHIQKYFHWMRLLRKHSMVLKKTISFFLYDTISFLYLPSFTLYFFHFHWECLFIASFQIGVWMYVHWCRCSSGKKKSVLHHHCMC